MSPRARTPYRRRNFFVMQWFQTRFALYPVGFFAIFLVGSTLYLRFYLREAFRLHLYIPHSHLGNPWELVAPALLRTATWGGIAFLTALALWGCVRFGRLRRDLDRLADWLAGLGRGEPPAELPTLSDREVLSLGRALHGAAEEFEVWDREVAARVRALVETMSAGSDDDRRDLFETREALERLKESLAAVRVDEALS